MCRPQEDRLPTLHAYHVHEAIRQCIGYDAEHAHVVQDIEKGNFAHALSKMLGVYVGLKGELLPPNVKQWNVLKLEVPKDDRHKDRPIVGEIFAAIDKFLAAHRSELAY